MIGVTRRSETKAICLMSGAFPPPVHGLSLANSRMRDAVLAAGGEVEIFNVAPPDGASKVPAPLRKAVGRAGQFGRLLARLAVLRRRARLYLPISGGAGQIGEIPIALAARAFGVPVAVHHHSFAYLDRPSRLTRMLFAACGRDATHIVLCERMGDLLRRRYAPNIGEVLPVSNSAFEAAAIVLAEPRDRLRRIGYLSNITLEKGFDRFLDIARSLKARGHPISATVAGPCSDSAARVALDAAIAEGVVTYRGPVYGADKERFLQETDVLVFPSRYLNEAEPLVVIEALTHGSPVVITERGCMPAMVNDVCGVMLDPSAADIEPAVARIEGWFADEAAFKRASGAALAQATGLSEASRDACDKALRLLVGA